MGALCSKSPAAPNKYSRATGHEVGSTMYQPNEFKTNLANEAKSNTESNLTPLPVRKSMEKQPQEGKELKEASSFHETGTTGYVSSDDDFYDGIPRFPRALSQKSRSFRSKQAAVAKVSEVSSRLGKAGTVGLGKAVDVLDTLGSSMTGFNPSSGFASGVTTKGNELQILAFEVANTIVKGSCLMQSLSKRSIRQLKEVVFPSVGVQHLVSKDINVLLTIVAGDKREELKIFSGEVIRFGNRCKDSQWHNLDLYFEKRSKESAPHKQLQEEAEQMMQQLMTLFQCTAELYEKLNVLDRLEQDYNRKRLEEYNPYAVQRGASPAILRAELKSQRKLVRNLKKKSLWSRSLEEVMEKLVDIVLFLNREIHIFGNVDGNKPSEGSLGNQQRLGPAGLALHYANIVIQIDTIVARSNSMPMPSSLRDTLYQSLPPSIKSSLWSKLQSFHVSEQLTVTEIKAEMEKTLHWLVPIAINTAKAHHGFGWVGEWANTRSEANRKPAGPIDVIQIETFHHADKEKTEACILELVLWLNHLINRSKVDANDGERKSPIKSPAQATLKETNQVPVQLAIGASSPKLSIEDREELQDIATKSRHEQYGFDKENTLDVIDRVDTHVSVT